MTDSAAADQHSEPVAAEEQSESRQVSLTHEALQRIRAQLETEREAEREVERASTSEDDDDSDAARWVELRAVYAEHMAEVAELAENAVTEMQSASAEVVLFTRLNRNADVVRERRVEGDPGIGRFLLQYVVTPLAVALVAGGFGLGAAEIAADNKSVAAPSCMQVYATALEIAKGHSGFRLPADDPDQKRCNVNSVLQSSTPKP